jgi:gamma-glutamyl hydrolase
VIGIVSQTIEAEMTDPAFERYDSYIMSSYVKYFEAQGARVVPLLITESDDEIFEKLEKLNGVVMPGGNGNYLDLGQKIFNKVKQINDNG